MLGIALAVLVDSSVCRSRDHLSYECIGVQSIPEGSVRVWGIFRFLRELGQGFGESRARHGGPLMSASDLHLETGKATDRKRGSRWIPPLMPVVLRIPRIVAEPAVLPKIAGQRSEFRWRAGIGAAILMVVAALPWLIRWHPPAENSSEPFGPAIQVEEASDIEILPPLYAKVTSASTGNTENESGMVEILDGLVVPPLAGGPQ